jgi:anaerobic magnesium-protoporphyrin IX monomethyl ester cyclase
MPDVVLINPHYVRRHGGGVVPPVGLCYLAGALHRVGATVEIIDLAALFPDYARDDDRPLKVLASLLEDMDVRPTLVGIGPLTTATLQPLIDISALCKALVRSRVVTGGPLCAVPGASAAIRRLTSCDALVVGDGERPIAELWAAGGDSRIPGYARAGDPDPAPWREPVLDNLPLPARELIGEGYSASWRRSTTGGRLTAAYLSRGCPYSCSFCAAPLSSGKTVRRASAARISEELRSCMVLGVEEIIFYDDCLFVRSPKLDARVGSFVEAVWASGWTGTFQLELRCDAVTAMSSDTLAALAAVGCRQINMGIEKGHLAGLRAVRKRLSPEVATEATHRVVSAGIRAAGTFILGGPGETGDDLASTVEFAEQLDLDFAHFNPLAVYPGTAIFAEVFGPAADWAVLCRDPEWAPFGDILWRDRTLGLAEILDAVRRAYTVFYADRRLARVLKRVPSSEHELVGQSFRGLGLERGHSWSGDRRAMPTAVDHRP